MYIYGCNSEYTCEESVVNKLVSSGMTFNAVYVSVKMYEMPSM